MQVPSVSGLFSARLNGLQNKLPVQLSFAQNYEKAMGDGQAELETQAAANAQPKQALMTLVPDTHYALEPEALAPAVQAIEAAPQLPEGQSYSSLGETLTTFAKQFVGNPYVWGGEDLVKGADCSGFTQSVFKNFGIKLPRTAYRQSLVGREIDKADLQPGDLLCFKDAKASQVGHVGLYIGDGKFVHACSTKTGIIISDLSRWKNSLYTIRRMPELETAVG